MIKAALLPSGLRKNKQSKSAKAPQAVPSNTGIVANRFDVLLGRGKGSYEWEGNVRYQQVISYYLPAYISTSKKNDKTQISVDIVSSVKRAGGRFLKETRGKLTEVTDKEARDKVAQALRHRRRAYDKGSSEGAERKMFSIPSAGFGGFTKYRDNLSGRTDDTDPVVSERSDYTRQSNGEEPEPESDHPSVDDDWRSLEELQLWEDSQAAVSEPTVEWQCPPVPQSFQSSSQQRWPSATQPDNQFSMAMEDAISDIDGLLDLPEAECGSDISSEFSLLDIGSVHLSDDQSRMSE